MSLAAEKVGGRRLALRTGPVVERRPGTASAPTDRADPNLPVHQETPRHRGKPVSQKPPHRSEPPRPVPPPSPPSWLERLGWITFDPDDTADQRLRKTMFLLTVMLTNLAAVGWGAFYVGLGVAFPWLLPVGYPVVSALLLIGFLRHRSFAAYRVFQLSVFLLLPFLIQWHMGGYVPSSGIVLLAMLAPLGALLGYGRRGSLVWYFAYAALTVATTVFEYWQDPGDETAAIPAPTVALFGVLIGMVLSTIAFFLLRYLVGQREQFQVELAEQHALLQAERETSEALLRSLLPPYIAARLKREAGLIADGHADVTVMFADMVGFTRLAGDLEPRQVVGLLNHVFTRMDNLCAQHGLEKIKTIGDAYMVVGGLNYEMDAYVEAMADMALQLQQTFSLDPIVSKYDIAFHVGIATGPAVAGVIGATRFSYDVWGDTVNLASRLTTDAVGGSILVDSNTHARLAGRYEFGDPVELPLKGKGRVTAYRLLGRRIRDQVPKTERQRDSTASLSRTRSPGATRA